MPSPVDVADGATDESIVEAIREQTHILLGRTISFSEVEWSEPSRLPGWTRAHVAAHIAQGASELVARAHAQIEGTAEPARSSHEDRSHELELASLADGLHLQIDLDTTAGELGNVLATLPEGSDIPITRLYELVLHGRDLATDVDDLGVEPEVAHELLVFWLRNVADGAQPRVHLISHEGVDVDLSGGADAAPRVTGPSADLLLWLARGEISDRIGGVQA